MTKVYDTAYFIERATKIHGNKYDYSKSEYINSKVKVTITCREHGDFTQLPSAHTSGVGCIDCAGVRRKTPEIFKSQAREVHGNKYSYENIKYKGSHTRIAITCHKHGDFLMFPSAHLRGDGCPRCAGRIIIDTEEFVRRSIEVHGERYNYSLAKYRNRVTPLKVICRYHGVFEQKPEAHFKGSGCPECAKSLVGWNRSSFIKFCKKNNNGIGRLYVIGCKSSGESFYKIGITSRSIKVRFSSSEKLPYDYDVLYCITGSPAYIYNLENRVHLLLRDFRYQPEMPFRGDTECFATIKPIEKLLKELSTTEQLQLLA